MIIYIFLIFFVIFIGGLGLCSSLGLCFILLYSGDDAIPDGCSIADYPSVTAGATWDAWVERCPNFEDAALSASCDEQQLGVMFGVQEYAPHQRATRDWLNYGLYSRKCPNRRIEYCADDHFRNRAKGSVERNWNRWKTQCPEHPDATLSYAQRNQSAPAALWENWRRLVREDNARRAR